mmetsp:Transcript_31506/g.57442  ORF Transcript_31506/g.57442 Transcript_31506/m.57442 type:complete len:685 (+) Transcript_31506:72-2126(+)
MAEDNVNGVATSVLQSPETEADSPTTGHSGDSNDYSRFENLSDDDSDDDLPAAEANSADCTEKVRLIGAAKVEGNGHVGKGDWKLAARQYRKGLKVVEDMSKLKPGPNPVQVSEAKELELSLQLNLAMAELKLENWAAATKAATKAVEMDPSNVKALFRRAQAVGKTGGLDEAAADLSQCLKLDPTNAAAKKELSAVRKRQAAHKASAKKSFSGLFDRAGGVYGDREEERKAKVKAKAEEEAKRRLEYEKEMTSKEKEFAALEAAAAAAAETPPASEAASEAAGEAAVPEVEEEEEGESGEKKAFERPSYEEWCKEKEKEKGDKKKAEEDKKKAASPPPPKPKAKPNPRSGSAAKAKASEVAGGEGDALELDEEDEALLAELKVSGGNRGYKVTADGRKTTYFNNDLDDEAKALIGNITPQKLTTQPAAGGSGSSSRVGAAAAAAAGAASSSGSAEQPTRLDPATSACGAAGAGGSVWNSGGTWEEKDCSEWAKASLKGFLKKGKSASGSDDVEKSMSPEALVKAFEGSVAGGQARAGATGSYEDPLAGLGALAAALAKVSVRVVKVGKVEGDASVAVVRGKKRFLFDLSAEIDYEVLVDESFGMDESADSATPARQATYKGKVCLADISHDAVKSEEVECSVRPKTKVPANHAERVAAVLEGLKKDLAKRCIPSFATEFQTKF